MCILCVYALLSLMCVHIGLVTAGCNFTHNNVACSGFGSGGGVFFKYHYPSHLEVASSPVTMTGMRMAMRQKTRQWRWRWRWQCHWVWQ
jgi:hypothetical protein